MNALLKRVPVGNRESLPAAAAPPDVPVVVVALCAAFKAQTKDMSLRTDVLLYTYLLKWTGRIIQYRNISLYFVQYNHLFSFRRNWNAVML